MDSEELYDSLEEEDFSAKCKTYSSTTWSEYDISSAVPLYLGDTPKEVFQKPKALKSHQHSRIPIKCDSKRSSYERIRSERCFLGTKYCNYATSSVDLLEYRSRNSYVNMFHAKNAKQNDKLLNDTVRSEYGDSTNRSNISDVSNVTHFSDAQSTISDSASFYFDIIKKMETKDAQPKKKCNKRRKSCSMICTVNGSGNLTSSSEFSVCNSVKSKSSKGTLDANLLVPKLGGLGPDLVATQEKLTRLQKQKSYGQKASDHNRIKMLEIKVLKELQAEIKNSKV